MTDSNNGFYEGLGMFPAGPQGALTFILNEILFDSADVAAAPGGPVPAADIIHITTDNQDFSGMVWNASLVLLRRLVQEGNLEVKKGIRVVELGAGTGLLSIGLAKSLMHIHGQHDKPVIFATDQVDALDLLGRNVDDNAVGDMVTVAPLDWLEFARTIAVADEDDDYEYDDDEAVADLGGTFDVVICSDCFYNRFTHGALRKSLIKLCNADSRIFLAWGDRESPQGPFFEDPEFSVLFESVPAFSFDSLFRGQNVHVREYRPRSKFE